MMGQIKDLMKLQAQAKQIKKKLENIHIEAEEGGVTVVIDGNLEIISVSISDDAWSKGKRHVEESTKTATKKGLKKAQEVAASNMQDVLGSMGLPANMLGNNAA